MSTPPRRVAPPSGEPPPQTAVLPDGSALDLVELAWEICARYRREYPDEEERYGAAGVAWCLHDNQHILNWAVLSFSGYTDLTRQLSWLCNILEARGFPLERLTRDLEIAADVVLDSRAPEGERLAAALRAGATHVAGRDSSRN
jgi:hypothetical protein